jgi:hypothetical protein
MTLVSLRPNATISNNGAVTGAGGVAHTALADDSDASFIAFDPIESARFDLTDLTLPAGAVVKNGAIRVRANASGTTLLYARLLSPTSTVYSSISNSSLTATIVNLSGSASTTFNSDPIADAAQITIQNLASGGILNVYEAYADVRYVVLPVVTVTAPTGTITNTTTPTVTWTDTLDTDGGAQTRYDVKIFSSAQYTAGGFDPSTSASTAASGIVSAADTSWVDTVALPNATYRAYVRVAQTVNGALLWSAWAFGGFVVSVTPPAVPTLAVTAQNINGRIQAVITTGGGATTTDRVELQRSVDGGTTWLPVRNTELDDGTITYPAAPVTILDYEAPNGTVTSYRARALHNYSGVYAASAWSTTQTATFTATDYWIKHPNVPALNMKLPGGTAAAMVSYPDVQRAARQTAFQPLGATLPVVVADTRAGATGTIVVQLRTTAEKTALDALLDRVATLLVQGPSSHGIPDRYVRIGDHSRVRVVDNGNFLMTRDTMAWTEVALPAGAQT